MPNLTRSAAMATAALLRRLLAHTPPGGRAWMARQMMQDRFDPASRALAEFCTQAIHAWKNKQYIVTENGEAALLERLRPFAPRIMLDVGANVGDWSLAACRSLPGTTVHAFEIAPGTAERFTRNATPFIDRIVINAIGLGDAERSITLYSLPQETDGTSASTVREALAASVAEAGLTRMDETEVQVTTGDAYLRRHGITHVDMLKIDVEGAEFSVLRGFAQAFVSGAIDLVQFEYGPLNLSTRDFLGDFYTFFDAHGYLVGKLYPEGVAFKPYMRDDEDFIGPNYVACRTARADIIAALRCSPLTF
jgi:FkbM family methyltransferase